MKLWTLATLCAASLLILSGCASTPTPKESIEIDRTLPMIELTQNGVIVDMKTVAFEWKSIKDPRVSGIYIYKRVSDAMESNELAHYKTIENRFTTHYVDREVNPNSKYEYAFATFSKNAQGEQSKSSRVTTLPVLESVSWIHSITGMPRSAKIIWRPHINSRVAAYTIQRKSLEDEDWSELATISGRLSAEYIDTDLKDNYVYMYRINSITYDGIVSTPSKIVKVMTKALPTSIKHIKTTKDLPRKIRIDWEKSLQKDFALYYLYKSPSIDGDYELIATLHNNRFVDAIDEDGKSEFYRVSVVDKDGLESEHENLSVQGMTLVKPAEPAIVEAKQIGETIVIEWSKSDPRSKSFTIAREHKKGWFETNTKEFTGIRAHNFVDKGIEAGSTYTYRVYGVDAHGIKSKPSIEVLVETPESTQLQEAPVKRRAKEVKVSPSRDTKQEVIAPLEDLNLSEI